MQNRKKLNHRKICLIGNFFLLNDFITKKDKIILMKFFLTFSSQKTKIEEGKDNISQQQKSKAELKAERRRKQEEQRAKKEEESRKKSEITKKVVKRVPDEIQADRACVEKKLAKKLEKEKIPPRTQAQRKVMLFSHLHQYEREFSLSRSYPVVGAHIHPSIMTLGNFFPFKKILSKFYLSTHNTYFLFFCLQDFNMLKELLPDPIQDVLLY